MTDLSDRANRARPTRRTTLLVGLVAAAVTAAAVVYAVRTGTTTTRGTGTTPAATAGVPLIDLGYVPLYPFENLPAAQAWERSYADGGHQPWHADARQTALAFASGYLGFTELGLVTATRMAADGAHVGVGYRNPAGAAVTAATVHLMRYGTDDNAPWEVVGTDDTSFTLDEPRYADRVHSPVAVGGVITGVDENVVVTVRQLQRDTPLGQDPGVPAGGQHSPWQVSVSYTGATPGPLLIVAYTGGHLQRVERFAVTGVYA